MPCALSLDVKKDVKRTFDRIWILMSRLKAGSVS